MDTSLSVDLRQDAGKGVARKLRASGKVPAVVYAQGGEARHGTIDPTRLLEIFRKSRNANTVIELQVDGVTVPAIVQEAQRHPVNRKLLHVDFYAVSKDRPVEVMVPVTTTGKSVGVAQGGRIEVIRRELRTRCPYDRIPEVHEIDVTQLDVGESVKASQVPVQEGVEIVVKTDINVVTCSGKKKK
jgi:large subunit ribosomal protein L25